MSSGPVSVVNGVCGSSNRQSFLSAPTTDLCSAGTASIVSGTGPWSWTCNGSSGGTTATCSANLSAQCSRDADCDDYNPCTIDTCDTGSGLCSHTPAPSTTVCRPAAGVCDVAELCTGTSTTCPADGFKPASTVCREATGECDVAETCTGTSAACPADAKKVSGTACTEDDNPCTVDQCDGMNVTCQHLPGNAGAVCRAAAGDCDVAEYCDGTSEICPADLKKDAGTACPDETPGNACTTPQCDGTSNACSHRLSCSLVTDSSLCTFDVDTSLSDNQFRLIFTPDPASPSNWKLNARNPGQYYYNIPYVYPSSGSQTVSMTLPYPFVTQGAMPIHIYNGVTITQVGSGMCFGPGAELGNSSTPSTLAAYSPQAFGSTKTVAVTLPSLSVGTFVYINIHLAYGLKATSNYSKDGSNNAIDATTLVIRIPDLTTYRFSDTTLANDTIESENTFKRNPGIGGLVQHSNGDEVSNVKVTIYDSTNTLLATVYTDSDGWYMWPYKYTGKAATFTVKLPAYGQSQSVTLKSNGFPVVSFTMTL